MTGVTARMSHSDIIASYYDPQKLYRKCYNWETGGHKSTRRRYQLQKPAHVTDYDSRSALHLACAGGEPRIVKFLLNNIRGYRV